jgi:uncharacterized iron-regulated membrane protein
MSSAAQPKPALKNSHWQEWLEHPEKTRIHMRVFRVHLWTGTLAAAWVFVMSVSGSLLVFRNRLEANSDSPFVDWVARLHENLLSGMTGTVVNGIGGLGLILLSITGVILWWPGIEHWRRSLTVDRTASFARLNWDLHNTLGMICLLFVVLWGVSGVYFVFPNAFNAVVNFLEPPDATSKLRFGDFVLQWLSELHFGRFNWFTEVLWSVLGLVPAVLSFTGMFMCWHRIFVRKGAPLDRQVR